MSILPSAAMRSSLMALCAFVKQFRIDVRERPASEESWASGQVYRRCLPREQCGRRQGKGNAPVVNSGVFTLHSQHCVRRLCLDDLHACDMSAAGFKTGKARVVLSSCRMNEAARGSERRRPRTHIVVIAVRAEFVALLVRAHVLAERLAALLAHEGHLGRARERVVRHFGVALCALSGVQTDATQLYEFVGVASIRKDPGVDRRTGGAAGRNSEVSSFARIARRQAAGSTHVEPLPAARCPDAGLRVEDVLLARSETSRDAKR